MSNTVNSNSAVDYDSGIYNPELHDLILSDPSKTLDIALTDLNTAIGEGDVEQQLVAYLYIASSYIILLDYEKSKFYTQKGLELSIAHNNEYFECEFLGGLAMINGYFIVDESALLNIKKSIDLARKLENDRLLAQQISIRGEIYYSLRYYDLAMKDIEYAIRYFTEHKDNESLSVNYNLLALIYEANGDYDNAIKFFKESMKYDDNKTIHNLVPLLENIAYTYLLKEDYTQALNHFLQSQALAKQMEGGHALAMINIGIAHVYYHQQKLDAAEELIVSAIKYLEESNDENSLFRSYNLLLDIAIINKQDDKIEKYFNLIKKHEDLLMNSSLAMGYLKTKFKYYVAQEMWRNVHQVNQQIAGLERKLKIAEKEKLTSELQIKFNADFDQEKLKFLEKQNQLQKQSLQQVRANQRYLWTVLTLGLFILLMTYLAYLQQRKNRQRLYQLSVTDHLTGVANRRQIIKGLDKCFKQAKSGIQSFSLIMIDLDYFKKINDNYGHDMGNKVLVYFADVCSKTLPKISNVGRIGGEEWLVIIESVDEAVINDFLTQLREAYHNANDEGISNELNLSFSSGVLVYRDQYQDYEQMLKDVDEAMYQAKQNGRDQDVFFKK